MRGIGEAMALDEASRKSDAYIKYLSCAFYTVQALLDDAAGRDIRELSREMCTKFFKLSEQCLERANDLMREFAGTDTVNAVHLDLHRLSPQMHMRSTSPSVLHRSRPSSPLSPSHNTLGGYLYPGPPVADENDWKPRSSSTPLDRVDADHSTTISATRSLPVASAMHSINPMEFAYRQNQHLITAYRTRMAKMNSEGARGKMNLTMRRRFQENMAIAKRRQDTLLAKIKDRERRQREAERSGRSAALGTVTSEELVEMADDFALKNSWVGAMQLKIASTPDHTNLIVDFIMKVLSSTDHPLARQLGTFQYNIYQQLLPLSRHFKGDLVQVVPPLETSVADRKVLATEERSGPSREAMGDSESSETDDMASEECPLAKLRAAVLNGGDQALSEESGSRPDKMKHTTISESSDFMNDEDSELSEILGHADPLSYVPPGSENQSVKTPTSPEDPLSNSAIAAIKATAKAEEFEYQNQLDFIIRDIHNYLDELQKGFMVCYKELDSPQGKDQCCSSIEQRFFPPIWPLLLALLRQSKLGSEKSLATVMSSMYHSGPKDFEVQERLCLSEESELVATEPSDENSTVLVPYHKAIERLRTIVEKKCPLEKLECIVSTSRCILECADEYWEAKGKGRQSKEATMGTDDLLPVLTYVVVKTRLPQLISECVAMEEFIHEGYLMGEEGYCLTSLNTAVAYGATLARKV